VRGNEWSESAPCCCYFNPQLIHTRSLETSSVPLNIIFSFQRYQTHFKFPAICKGSSSCVTFLTGFDVDKMLSALLSLIVFELHYWFLNIDQEMIMNHQLMDQLTL